MTWKISYAAPLAVLNASAKVADWPICMPPCTMPKRATVMDPTDHRRQAS